MSSSTCVNKCYKENNMEGFFKGVEKMTAHLVHHFGLKVGNSIDVEDIIQDSKMRVWEAMGKYDADKGSVATYCNMLIYSTVMRHAEKSNIQYKYGTAPNTEDELEVVSRLESSSLGDKYSRLAVEFKIDMEGILNEEELFILKEIIRGKTPTEIGELMGLSHMTVYRRWGKIQNKIKKWIKSC